MSATATASDSDGSVAASAAKAASAVVVGGSHNLVRLGLELGLAVNDYNSGFVNNLDEVNKITLAYLKGVKVALKDKIIAPKEIRDYFALVGQSWGSIVPRFENEYLEELKD